MVVTKDGTNTLYSEQYDEHYHSVLDGAVVESMKKHIEPAFKAVLDDATNEVAILDICFGLGYNVLSAIKYISSLGRDISVKIISPELNRELVVGLVDFDYPDELAEFKHIVEQIAKYAKYSDKNTSVEVFFESARDTVKRVEASSMDIVFQDAFSPKNNRELWTVEYFCDIRRLMKPKSVLTTYTKSTGVRLAMLEAGFKIYEYNDDAVRSGTIAGVGIEGVFVPIDMTQKLKNAPNAKAFRD